MSSVQPLRRATATLLRVAPQLAPHLERLMWRTVYEAASLRRGKTWTPLMNYGFAPLDDREPDNDDPTVDYGLRLYERVAGALDLTGLDVLEVGCGRGGGTSFVHGQFKPRSMTGIDLARTAVERCRTQYGRPGLQFEVGDAEALPCADGRYDVVLSVESSHCYADIDRFLGEVRRVLRPGGALLIADFRQTGSSADTGQALFRQDDVAGLRRRFSQAGLRVTEEEDITPNVIRALQLDTPRRRARIERRFPRFMHPYVLAFSATEGTSMYQAYADGTLTYLRFVLRRD